MKVLVGLGNPGRSYHGTRHNVGFAVIQALSDRHQVSCGTRVVHPGDGRPAAVYGEYEDSGTTVRLLMPQTMMNESGDALRALPTPTEDLLLICDDVNLPLGALRLRPHGSDGGHHGLRSCLDALGTDCVARLRIGVGASPLPRDLEEFVLSPFAPPERPVIARMVAQAADACAAWLKEGIEAAMNRYNRAQDAQAA